MKLNVEGASRIRKFRFTFKILHRNGLILGETHRRSIQPTRGVIGDPSLEGSCLAAESLRGRSPFGALPSEMTPCPGGRDGDSTAFNVLHMPRGSGAAIVVDWAFQGCVRPQKSTHRRVGRKGQVPCSRLFGSTPIRFLMRQSHVKGGTRVSARVIRLHARWTVPLNIQHSNTCVLSLD